MAEGKGKAGGQDLHVVEGEGVSQDRAHARLERLDLKIAELEGQDAADQVRLKRLKAERAMIHAEIDLKELSDAGD